MKEKLRQIARSATNAVRSLPDFLIIGAMRSGTTSLYGYLKNHPQIRFGTIKELHYFDGKWTRGLSWYRAQFPMKIGEAWSREWGGKRILLAEATPAYLIDPRVPERAARVLPKARVIAILRHPVERAYSHYHFTRRRGRETLSFQEALDQEERRMKEALADLSPTGNTSSRAMAFFLHSYMTRGLYAEQLRRWFQYFDRSQFLILKSEDLYRYPKLVLDTITRFLGLPPLDQTSFRRWNSGSYRPMPKEIFRQLSERFEEPNKDLANLLGWDPGWSLRPADLRLRRIRRDFGM